ncbi:MAG: hypothetical protein ACE5JB_02730 [bacterium]
MKNWYNEYKNIFQIIKRKKIKFFHNRIPCSSFNKFEEKEVFGNLDSFLLLYFPVISGLTTVPFIGGQLEGGYAPGDNPFFFGVLAGVKMLIPHSGGDISIQSFYLRQNFE